MLILFIILWTIGIILLLSKGKSNYWASMVAFCGGAGGLSVVIDEQIYQGLALHGLDHILIYSALQFMDSLFSFIAHYGTPYSFLIFSLCYSGLFTSSQIKKYTYVLAVPIVLMYLFFPFYPTLEVPYLMASLWVVPYKFVGVLSLVYSYFVEKSASIKKNRLLTNIVIVPAIIFSLVTSYIFRIYNIEDAWRYNSWMIIFSAILFLIFVGKYGFMGVKLSLHNQRITHTMRTMNSGTAMLQHAIKNDIGKIKLFSSKIEDYAMQHSEVELQEDVRVIIEAQEHINYVFNRLQDQTKDSSLELEEVNIVALINHNLYSLKPTIKSKNIEIHTSYSSELTENAYLMCDREQLKEVIYNILLNAVEAIMHAGDIYLDLKQTDRHLVIEIKDTGVGMLKETLPHIFTPFYTTKSQSKVNYGLGLAYCYNVMKKHAGNVKVESEAGIGTTVFLHFPSKSVINKTGVYISGKEHTSVIG